MACSKQTLQKSGMNYNAAGAHHQGTPARFPGKPTGKTGRQLAAMSQDANDSSSSDHSSMEEGGNEGNLVANPTPVPPVVQNAIRAGRCRRGVGSRAWILIRKPVAPGTTQRKYKPGVWALKEVSFYQKEYGLICAKAAVA